MFPAPPVKAPIICYICSGVRLDGSGGASPLPFVSGFGVDVEAIVFLLVGTASVSSESEYYSWKLSVSYLAARECCIDSAKASPSPSGLISPAVRSIS